MPGGVAIYLRERAQSITAISKACREAETKEKLDCLAAEFMEKALQLEALFSISPGDLQTI